MKGSEKALSLLAIPLIIKPTLFTNSIKNKSLLSNSINHCQQSCDHRGNIAFGEGASPIIRNNPDSSIGTHNTVNGSYSLHKNVLGTDNTTSGSYSLHKNTIGSYNTANGFESLRDNKEGEYNTSGGYNALKMNITGKNNTAVGASSILFNRRGNNNTATGKTSMLFNNTGNNNTAIGYASLYNNKNGNNNISLGYGSGYNTIGSNNILIGNISEEENNAIRIGRSKPQTAKLNSRESIELAPHERTYLVGPLHIEFNEENKSDVVIDRDEFNELVIRSGEDVSKSVGNTELQLRSELKLLRKKISKLEDRIEATRCRCGMETDNV